MVILVGNGTSLLDKDQGDIIDSFDTVVRFNSFKTQGFESHTGVKTNVWFTVNDTHKDLVFDKVYAHSWQPHKDRCTFYKDLYSHIPCIKLSKEDILSTGMEYPSTGLIAIFKMLETNDFVTLVGFDWWERSLHHYGDNEVRGTLHKPKEEEKIIRRLEKEGKIKFL